MLPVPVLTGSPNLEEGLSLLVPQPESSSPRFAARITGDTVMLAVAVFEVPAALLSVKLKLAVPEKSGSGVKMTLVDGKPVTVPPNGIPTSWAAVGLPDDPCVRSMVTGASAVVV